MDTLSWPFISFVFVHYVDCGVRYCPKTAFSTSYRYSRAEGTCLYLQRSRHVFPPGVVVGNTAIGLPDRAYYFFFLDPGDHTILASTIKPEEAKKFTIHVRKNHTYFIKVTAKTHFGGRTDIEINGVSNQIGREEIKECHLGVMVYGKSTLVKGYYSDEISEVAKRKATIQLYRSPSTLSNSGIADFNIGLYSGSGSNMVALGLDQCETYRFYADPGLIRCVLGNMAFSEIGKAAFRVGSAMTGITPDTPGKEFTEIETGLREEFWSWDFDAEAGKVYYLEFDPHKRFKFIEPSAIKSACLSRIATVIEKRDISFLEDIIAHRRNIGVAWIRSHEQASAQYHGKIRYAGGLLDYLFVDVVSSITDVELKNKLRREMLPPKIKKDFLDRIESSLRQHDAIIHVTDKAFIDDGSLAYSNVADSFDSDYVYILEILNFCVTRTHSGILPIVFSGKPVAFASIKGIVIDNKTKKEVFRKPFNGFEAMSDRWNDPPDYEECLRKLDKALKGAIMAFVEGVS